MDNTQIKQRTLSLPRLGALILVFALFGGWIYVHAQSAKEPAPLDPWFAPYVDVTATPIFSFQHMGDTKQAHAVLSFIVAKPDDACVPTWGTAYTLDEANAALTLDTRIARLRQRGGDIVISFGGRDNQELSVVCTEEEKLVNAYRDVINRYDIDTIDLDIETTALEDPESNQRRARVIKLLQEERQKNNEPLHVWLTLPVAPFGLTEAGTAVIATFLENGVDIAGVNVMTMNYGQSLIGNSMLESSKQALIETHRQLGILYDQAGVPLRSDTLWTKLGATPMIGQNDLDGEVFTLSDADQLNAFSVSRGMGRMSLWSANRDVACGSNYANLDRASDSCSGVSQDAEQFMHILGRDFSGAVSSGTIQATVSDATERPDEIVDDPQNSPYQIWTETGVYVQGTRVVWRKNVYQAKWWTQGEVPDNPVLQTWETPWELIGPVLPGDKPMPQPTLPEGTYPTWKGTDVYNAGERVLLDGVPYQAKWWTQGDSPAASSANSSDSPWIPLTLGQINEVLERQ